MSRDQVRTDPAIIRAVLTDADTTNPYQAAKKHGIHTRTITRWITRRETIGPHWPTDQDIAEWRRDQATHRAHRARRAKESLTYRKRVYLNRGPLQLPALGTTRRLQALNALGWTAAEMGERLGVTDARIGHLIAGMYPTVFPSTARAVAKLYKELSMTVPQDDDTPRRRGQVRVHDRARRAAAKRGYVPPLAWDDIDNPDETPQGVGYTEPNKHDRRLYTIQHLAEQNADPETTAAHLGITKEALWKWCVHHGHRELYHRLAANRRDAA